MSDVKFRRKLHVFTDLETGGFNGVYRHPVLKEPIIAAPMDPAFPPIPMLGCQAYPILEVAVILTDENFNEVGRYYSPVRITPADFDKMSAWAKDNHVKTGLLDRCYGPAAKSLQEIDSDVAALIKQHMPNGNERGQGGQVAVLSGSSVWFDRTFVMSQMPQFEKCLWHRLYDVSNMAEELLSEGVLDKPFHKEYHHGAMEDIQETIAEAKYYRERLRSIPRDTGTES